MKKFITILLILSAAFCFTVVGCKTKRNDDTGGSQSVSETESGGETNESQSTGGSESGTGEEVITPSPDSDWALGEIPI